VFSCEFMVRAGCCSWLWPREGILQSLSQWELLLWEGSTIPRRAWRSNNRFSQSDHLSCLRHFLNCFLFGLRQESFSR
jgi:hypothetical protein